MSTLRVMLFEADERGRAALELFQQRDDLDILHITTGEFVRDGKKEPGCWLLYQMLTKKEETDQKLVREQIERDNEEKVAKKKSPKA